MKDYVVNVMKDKILVTIPPEAAGKRLSLYLAKAGYRINADCGGKGSCGKCIVQLVSGCFYSEPNGKECILPDKDGFIKSCRAWCSEKGAEIMLPAADGTGLESFSGMEILNNGENNRDMRPGENMKDEKKPNGKKYNIAVDIGTTTLAFALIDAFSGKIVKTSSCLNPEGSFGADVMSRISAANDGNLYVMQRMILNAVSEMTVKMLKSVEDEYGGESKCSDNGKSDSGERGNENDSGICDGTLNRPEYNVGQMVIVGNTTMLHIFCGVSPAGMGVFPFTPEFTDMKILPGIELNIPADNVIVLPSVSAFIGADITAGAYAVNITENDEPAVLMDIGTNGEMMLFTGKNHSGRLFAASAAAGPAMEGAGISSGVGGIAGAVCKVHEKRNPEFAGETDSANYSVNDIENDSKNDSKNNSKGNSENDIEQKCAFDYETISNLPPIGICGSGLIDLISVLLKTGKLDETGYLEDESVVYAENKGTEFILTQEDVRSFQLAKSAVRAAFEALADHAGIMCEHIETVYLAGGLGYYMNVQSAADVGLLPECVRSKIKSVGNSALGGAVLFLQNYLPGQSQNSQNAARNILSGIADLCKTVDLNFSDVFQSLFIEHMMFPEN